MNEKEGIKKYNEKEIKKQQKKTVRFFGSVNHVDVRLFL